MSANVFAPVFMRPLVLPARHIQTWLDSAPKQVWNRTTTTKQSHIGRNGWPRHLREQRHPMRHLLRSLLLHLFQYCLYISHDNNHNIRCSCLNALIVRVESMPLKAKYRVPYSVNSGNLCSHTPQQVGICMNNDRANSLFPMTDYKPLSLYVLDLHFRSSPNPTTMRASHMRTSYHKQNTDNLQAFHHLVIATSRRNNPNTLFFSVIWLNPVVPTFSNHVISAFLVLSGLES